MNKKLRFALWGIILVGFLGVTFIGTSNSRANWFFDLFKKSDSTNDYLLHNDEPFAKFIAFYNEKVNYAAKESKENVDRENIENYRSEFIDAYGLLLANYVYHIDSSKEDKILAAAKDAILKREEELNKEKKAITPKDITYAALNAVYSSVDPHTAWLSPEDTTMLKNSIEGEYVGVGIVLGVEKSGKYVTAISVIEGGPAYKAGIKDGDILYEVNGKEYKGSEINAMATALKGKKHTKVSITVKRGGEIKTFKVTRAEVHLKSVSSQMLDNKYAYLRISNFGFNTTKEFREALRKLNINEAKGIILDLRSNPGGLLYSSLIISEMFINNGKLLSVKGRNKDDDMVYYASKHAYVNPDIPMVILVNNMTASAAEIVSAALSQTGRAIVMGQPSFGKGSVQTMYDLKDGSSAKITIQLFYTPNDTALQGIGVVPDIYINPVKKNPFFNVRETDYKNYLVVSHNGPKPKEVTDIDAKNCKPYTKAEDYEIGCAVEYFTNQQLMKKVAFKLKTTG